MPSYPQLDAILSSPAGHTQEFEWSNFGTCALDISEYRWQSHCADMVSISTIISDFWAVLGVSRRQLLKFETWGEPEVFKAQNAG